jgi:hypothetical protein
MTSADSEIWAITSVFNPAGYQQRYKNFKIFREHVAVPLVTVELGYGDDFELKKGDSDVLVQLRGSSVLWQKECLLNIALSKVPARVPVVAWLDCDVIFQRSDWATQAVERIQQNPLIQLFSEVEDLPQGITEPGSLAPQQETLRRSVTNLVENGDWRVADPGRWKGSRTRRRVAYGLAWAARRDLLARHAFYDAMVVGSGDRALVCAGYGRYQDAISHLHLNPARATHYLDWAQPFHREVQGNIGGLAGRLYHLWHGDIPHRGYKERHVNFEAVAFDPAIDLMRDSDGILQWASERSDLETFARTYFASRCEDGTSG